MAADTLRPAPEGDQQPDFFVPNLWDLPLKDGVELMDIAVFRLSRRHTQAGQVIRHELGNGCTVEVSGGGYGMATVWDYDLVLMMISALAEAAQAWRAGNAPKPATTWTPHTAEILKFCRRGDGGAEYQLLEGTLNRLQGTFVKVISENGGKRRAGYFPLLAGADIVSRTDSGKIGRVRLQIPSWIYEAVTAQKRPLIYTMHPDYFLIKGGFARFLYRYARKACHHNPQHVVDFATLHARSGGQGAFKRFAFEIRRLVADNALPDFYLQVQKGKNGQAQLAIARLDHLPALTGDLLAKAAASLKAAE